MPEPLSAEMVRGALESAAMRAAYRRLVGKEGK